VGSVTIASGSVPSDFSRNNSAWRHANHSGLSSCDKSVGLMNGTSAPYCLATSAISSESVETMTRSIRLLASACSIDHAISGLPSSRRIFFPGNPLDPPRANINAIALIFNLFHIYLFTSHFSPPVAAEFLTASMICNTINPSFPSTSGLFLLITDSIKSFHSSV
jgi:hypothetical protein